MAHKQKILGLALAALALALDQLSKWWLMPMVAAGPMSITPFFNLVMVWNTGISFGMFAGGNQPLFLIALSAVILAVLIRWLWKSPSGLVTAALGLIIGGATGNVIDRLHMGAVADFFDFYLGHYHWPAFNIADSCIFIGVVVLCAHSMLSGKGKEPS